MRTENGTSGVAADTLDRERADDITRDTERVLSALRSPDGLGRVEDGEQRRVEFPVVMVATDRRLVFVPADPAKGGEAGEVVYADLRTVEVGDSVTLRTTGGVAWRLPVGRAGVAGPHLRWVGELRERVDRLREDISEAADQLPDLADAGGWADAEGTYTAHRARLDRALDAVQRCPVALDSLAPRLTALERELERAAGWLWLARAEAELEGDSPTDSDPEVGECYDRARSHAWAARRGDGFRFGEQRELLEALADLRGRLDGDAPASDTAKAVSQGDGGRAGAVGR
jgi:hypothetical protein